ncbi:hypothetical protein HUU42_02430 [bacterium]|nr:hypothetical protein [bacterium]
MFGLFNKKKSAKIQDTKIWRSQDEKFSGILSDVIAAQNSKIPVLIVAHFKTTFESIQKHLDAKALTGTALRSSIDLQRWMEGHYNLALAMSDVFAAITSGSAVQPMKAIVAEYYPVPSKDQMVANAVGNWPSPVLIYHEALDSALMKRFGAERILALAEKLGWEHGTSLNHLMITRSFENIQEKIQAKSRGDLSADSPEQWFDYNFSNV